jgi:hypothetical protein
MALTSDIKAVRYGTGQGREPANLGLLAGVTVYRGSIALESGASPGYLKNAASPAASDLVWGIIQKVGTGSGQIDGAPGITGGLTNGAVTVEIEQGTFFLGSSTGADQLSVANIGAEVYVYNENTVAATSASSTRPVAGILVAIDTSGRYPGGYAVKLASNPSTGGGF